MMAADLLGEDFVELLGADGTGDVRRKHIQLAFPYCYYECYSSDRW